MPLTLASGSPRRLALLEELGLNPTVRPADIDETPRPGESAATYVERLAVEKGAAVTDTDDVIISADTIVVLDGELLGKPLDDANAASMLRRLSGRTHEVMTGVAVRRGDEVSSFVETTIVHFAELSDADIAWYVGPANQLTRLAPTACKAAAERSWCRSKAATTTSSASPAIACAH